MREYPESVAGSFSCNIGKDLKDHFHDAESGELKFMSESCSLSFSFVHAVSITRCWIEFCD